MITMIGGAVDVAEVQSEGGEGPDREAVEEASMTRENGSLETRAGAVEVEGTEAHRIEILASTDIVLCSFVFLYHSLPKS